MKKMITIVVMILAITASSLAFAAELSGIVTDKDGKPVQTKLVLKSAEGAPVGQPASSDKNGAYSFKDIKPGSYQVVIGSNNEWKIFVGPGGTRRDFRLK